MAEARKSRTAIPRASTEEPDHDTITESGDRTRNTASSDVYPTGIQLALLLLAVFVTMFLVALDRLVISTAIPQITDEFGSVTDIGWYGSAYLLTNCAFQLLPLSYSLKLVPRSSVAFIFGRAIAGLGSAGIMSGTLLDYWYRRPIPANAFGPAEQSGHDIVRLGFSHHYLLNSILALAALQLFDEDRSQTRWYARAVVHWQAAITRARPHVQQLDESHCRALLSFCFYTSMYALAEPLRRPALPSRNQPSFDPVKELVQAIRLGRSSTSLVQQHLASVTISDPFLVGKFYPCKLAPIQGLESAFPQLVSLRALIQRQCMDQERVVCLHAAESLFVSIAHIVGDPGNPAQIRAIWGWASHVDSAFLDMCSAHHTAAIVIFARFAVLMHLGGDNWNLQRWPAVLLRQIRGLLKDDMEDPIRWPEEVVFGKTLVPSLRVQGSIATFDCHHTQHLL
ncbi:hypothetical protein KXV81_007347 [Aspergillus fumigatus]|nr:hypothetical protein KXX26_007238 [Aspergillus fumigatus]KAH1706050.1 hypothetical protein KXX24_005723 [Aspergillus fumigatus]KAH2473328.1 hypothetical protein KXV61_001592 [Aspergillus fumigatus]KAH3399100.1 hypothetical protein KXW79_007103 [Aspergillus fumigatus]KAH3408506.1 hypothetical protein KXV81_007347 [Aspergillus fumigatus]